MEKVAGNDAEYVIACDPAELSKYKADGFKVIEIRIRRTAAQIAADKAAAEAAEAAESAEADKAAAEAATVTEAEDKAAAEAAEAAVVATTTETN